MEDRFSSAVYRFFAAIFILSALAAYAVGPIPIPWIAQALTVCLFAWIGFRSRLKMPPGMTMFACFFAYAVVVTLFMCATGDYYSMMPTKATTGYFTYIGLRFFSVVSFGAFAMSTYWLLLRGYGPRIMRFLTLMCLFLSVAALYIYVAQVFGLPEPPRTRMGTTGGEQATHFTYAFHRAMGTFREPSHFAGFLLLPLLASLSRKGMLYLVARVLGVIVLLLTGSLTGLGSLIFGLGCGFLLFPYINKSTYKSLGRLVTIVFVGFFGFSVLVSGYKGDVDLITVLWSRIEPMMQDGAKSSNRNYVYEYFDQVEVQWVGDGLGNSNLVFSKAMNSGVPVSFLSLYLNMLLSLGYFGFGMFLVFILTPILLLVMNRRYQYHSDHYLMFAAYAAWMLVYSADPEEFQLPFAVVYALVVYGFSQQKPFLATTTFPTNHASDHQK